MEIFRARDLFGNVLLRQRMCMPVWPSSFPEGFGTGPRTKAREIDCYDSIIQKRGKWRKS